MNVFIIMIRTQKDELIIINFRYCFKYIFKWNGIFKVETGKRKKNDKSASFKKIPVIILFIN